MAGEEKAVQAFRDTELPLPRFVSLRSNKVHARTGPALRYPIRWVYQRENLPVEIVQEFESWRKIRDMNGDEGWVHQSLLSGIRTILVKEGEDERISMYEKEQGKTKIVAFLEPNVIATVQKCTDKRCEIQSGGFGARHWECGSPRCGSHSPK